MNKIILTIIVAVVIVTPLVMAFLPSNTEITKHIILDTKETLIGQQVEPTKVRVITLPPGAETGFHTHDDVLVGYVISGEITVDYEDHSITLKKGESGIQAINHSHNEINTGLFPAQILVVEIEE